MAPEMNNTTAISAGNSGIFTPEDETQLSQFVRECALNNSAVKIIGGGTKQSLGHRVAGIELSTRALSGITLYEPASLTIVAGAGTTLKEIETALAANDQHLPFEPADYRMLLESEGDATIGGIVACAISGPRRIQAGALRDSLIGVRFVNGEGDTIKSGGRVMKNVTGYDLVKLLAGSFGTLGIITQVSFKLLPAPQKTAVLLINGLDDIQAVAAMSVALGSPFDITGAAHTPSGLDGEPLTMLRLEGFEKSVDYRAQKLTKLLSEFGQASIENSPAKTKAVWKRVRDVEAFANKPGAVWRLSMTPGDGPKVVENISQTRPVEALYDWGGGLVWLLTPNDEGAGEDIIRAKIDDVGGHATLIGRVNGQVNIKVRSVFHPQSKSITKLSEGLRRQFDPHGILNPHRMGG